MREIQLPRSDGSSWEIIDAGVAAIKAPIRRIHWFADDGGVLVKAQLKSYQ